MKGIGLRAWGMEKNADLGLRITDFKKAEDKELLGTRHREQRTEDIGPISCCGSGFQPRYHDFNGLNDFNDCNARRYAPNTPAYRGI